eukprot:jgi/Chlat1/6806/Chrsp51S06507
MISTRSARANAEEGEDDDDENENGIDDDHTHAAGFLSHREPLVPNRPSTSYTPRPNPPGEKGRRHTLPPGALEYDNNGDAHNNVASDLDAYLEAIRPLSGRSATGTGTMMLMMRKGHWECGAHQKGR